MQVLCTLHSPNKVKFKTFLAVFNSFMAILNSLWRYKTIAMGFAGCDVVRRYNYGAICKR